MTEPYIVEKLPNIGTPFHCYFPSFSLVFTKICVSVVKFVVNCLYLLGQTECFFGDLDSCIKCL